MLLIESALVLPCSRADFSSRWLNCSFYLGTVGFFAGTALIGIGLACINVLIPILAKAFFPHRIEVVTSMYVTAMTFFSALTAGVSVPIP
jgi:cyanate permease